uniref:Uncharacterized protein n=1 Tax=Anopheles farauti TaxID=69004 RepID=A0A182QYA0_9DIPT
MASETRGEGNNTLELFTELFDKIFPLDVVATSRRSQKGLLQLKLKRSTDGNAVKDCISAMLKDGQKAILVTEMVEMVVTNLDPSATVEEVSEAVSKKLGSSVPPASIKLWRCQDGFQRARFRYAIKQAAKDMG